MWHGAVEGAVWAEGPHLYRRAGDVLLVASEGGTERHHAVSAARGASPTGPFTGSRANPLLTHRHLGGDAPVANVGHADLVDDGRGGWWATVLATRRLPLDGTRADALQGRETWLVPVVFEDGWPVFAPGTGRLAEEVEVPWADAPAIAARSLVDDFDGPTVHPELVSVRTAAGARRALLGERPGHLRLHAVSGGLHEHAPHAFAGFRLEQPVATLVDGARGTGCPVARPARRARSAALRAPTPDLRRARRHCGPHRGTRAPCRRRRPRTGHRRGARGATRPRPRDRRLRGRRPGRGTANAASRSARPTSRRSARVRAEGSSGSSAGCSSWASPLVTKTALLWLPRPISKCSAWCTRRRDDMPHRAAGERAGGCTGTSERTGRA